MLDSVHLSHNEINSRWIKELHVKNQIIEKLFC